ncbi:MAG: hypothetical protein R3257_03565, partial [bacterium]|nr:hypothetical protein [bacterium]
MSPPNIQNSLIGLYSRPPLPEGEERGYSPTRLALEDPGFDARELARQGRDFLTRGLGRRYGQRLQHRFGQESVEALQATLAQGRRMLENGSSRGYFIILRSLFLLLPHQNPSQLDETLREVLEDRSLVRGKRHLRRANLPALGGGFDVDEADRGDLGLGEYRLRHFR